jgi:hypothetical protein
MRNCIFLILAIKVYSRILKSNRAGVRDNILLVHDHHHDHHSSGSNSTIHEDPDHTDVDLRRKGRRKRSGHGHTGTVVHVRKRNNRHPHSRSRRHNTPFLHQEPNANTPAGRALAKEAAAISAHTGVPGDDVAEVLKNAPHTSAPMNYSSMEEVKAGSNPEIDKSLSLQNLMDGFRNFLPKVGQPTEDIMAGAEEILSRAPNGNPNAPFVNSNGERTGRTFGEEAEALVRNGADALAGAPSPGFPDPSNPLSAENARIDQAMLGNYKNPGYLAEEEFQNLVRSGVPPANASQLAERIAKGSESELKERIGLADALKESAKDKFVAANHRQLQEEIQDEKINDAAFQDAVMNDEMRKQRMFPALHPIHLNEEELGYLKQIGNQLPPSEIGRRMFDAYNKSAQSGETEADARAAAGRTGFLLSEFNNELRRGIPPDLAADIIKERGNIQDSVEQRRNFVQNNGPEIAQLVAENTQLVQEAAAKIARNPERKEEILEELDDEMKQLAAKHSNFIHERSNIENIHKPRKAAEDLIDETKFLNNEIINIAHSAPIVAKDIIKKGMDNARETAKAFNRTLDTVDSEEKRHSPIPKSALKLLDEAKKEQHLDSIARKNAEDEKKRRDQLIKETKDAEVMATEERLARDNRARKIKEQGMKAAENVLRSGGTIEEAKAVKSMAEQRAAQAMESKEASVRNDVLRSLANGVDPERARRIAAHVASAHTGENAIGKTSEEVMANELEDRKREALEKALYSDFSNEKVDVIKIIPTDASEVNVNNSSLKFPLNTFVDEKPKDKGEEFVKNRADVLKNLVRNTVTQNRVESGLNMIQTSDGWLNLGENSNKIFVTKAVAFIKPSGKLQMEKEGIDTSKWKSRHNQGERPDIPNGELYYEAEVNNADLPLPSPTNKTPGKFMSNADEQLDANHIDELHIIKGTLHQIPWSDFSDLVHPRLNLYPNEEEKIKEANMFKDALAEEKKKEKLDSIKIYSFTNPNGDKHITTVPQYGIPETFEEKEGMKRLSNIDPDKNIAISETPTESEKEPMINPLDNIPEDQLLKSFIDNTIAEGRSKKKAGKFISPVNAFTGAVDKNKSEMLQIEQFNVNKHFINDGSEASRVKNDLISHTQGFARQLGMSNEEFVGLVKRIPDSVIYKMDKYNEQPNKKPTDLLDEDFSKAIMQLSDNHPSSSLINYIFTSISKITGKPNNVSATILEKHIIPNLKAVETTLKVTTNNGSTETTKIEPPKLGSTVISEVNVNGLPNISTGRNTSYVYPNPARPPVPITDSRVRNGGKDPLVSSNKATLESQARANPNNTPSPVSPPNQQLPPRRSPVPRPGGNGSQLSSSPTSSPSSPSSPPGLGMPEPKTPNRPAPRIGIASSPQK